MLQRPSSDSVQPLMLELPFPSAKNSLPKPSGKKSGIQKRLVLFQFYLFFLFQLGGRELSQELQFCFERQLSASRRGRISQITYHSIHQTLQCFTALTPPDIHSIRRRNLSISTLRPSTIRPHNRRESRQKTQRQSRIRQRSPTRHLESFQRTFRHRWNRRVLHRHRSFLRNMEFQPKQLLERRHWSQR